MPGTGCGGTSTGFRAPGGGNRGGEGRERPECGARGGPPPPPAFADAPVASPAAPRRAARRRGRPASAAWPAAGRSRPERPQISGDHVNGRRRRGPGPMHAAPRRPGRARPASATADHGIPISSARALRSRMSPGPAARTTTPARPGPSHASAHAGCDARTRSRATTEACPTRAAILPRPMPRSVRAATVSLAFAPAPPCDMPAGRGRSK